MADERGLSHADEHCTADDLSKGQNSLCSGHVGHIRNSLEGHDGLQPSKADAHTDKNW